LDNLRRQTIHDNRDHAPIALAHENFDQRTLVIGDHRCVEQHGSWRDRLSRRGKDLGKGRSRSTLARRTRIVLILCRCEQRQQETCDH
jgi:hypothetical protein